MSSSSEENPQTPKSPAPRTTSAFCIRTILSRSSIRHVEYHPELPSTSDTAAELLTDLLDTAPALVLTDRQTAGRGRRGNSWEAAGGALTFSVVLDADSLDLAPSDRSLIAIAAGVAVRDALVPLLPGRRVQLKWPNDVLVDGGKICGILIEQHGVPHRAGVVIGVGINVNNSFRQADSDLRHTATSLFDLLDTTHDLQQLLLDVLTALPLRLSQLTARRPVLMAEVNSAHVLNQNLVVVQHAETECSGKCLGVDDDGCLVLARSDGVVSRLRSGTVVEWQPGQA